MSHLSYNIKNEVHFTTTTILFGYLVLLTFASAEIYITSISNITACPNANVPCLTLTEYAIQPPNTSPRSNITLTFEPGHHYLGLHLQVINVNNLILQAADSNNSVAVVVTCTHTGNGSLMTGFIFENIARVSIRGLEFNECEENTVRSVDQFRLEDCSFHAGHGIELERIKIASIERSSFVSLTGRSTKVWWEGSAMKTGGAIVSRYSFVALKRCQFDGNKAEYGGSIYSVWSDILVRVSNFTNNAADIAGGIILAYSGTINIFDSKIIKNTADGDGSIIYTNSGTVNIHDNTFVNNSATCSGTIYAYSGTVNVYNSLFINNTAYCVRVGGLIITVYGFATIQQSTFVSKTRTKGSEIIDPNRAVYMIYNTTQPAITAVNENKSFIILPTSHITCPNKNMVCMTLTQYAQQSLEPAPSSKYFRHTLIFVPGQHYLHSNLLVKNSVPYTNIMTSLHLQTNTTANNLLIPVATITCNNTGFVFENIPEVSVSGLVFNGCKENSVRSVDRFRLEGCRFHTGHGIELERIENATIARSSFVSLTAKETKLNVALSDRRTDRVEAGGAIISRNSTLMINTCHFKENLAQYGGLIYSEYSDIEINTSYISNNTAESDGGALYAHNSIITLQKNVFANNRAENHGSILFAHYCTVTIQCQESIFVNNRAHNGSKIGAVNSTVNIQEKEFTNITGNKTYNILPASEIICSDEKVTSLPLFAQQLTAPTSKITLRLSPGNHCISSYLRVNNIASLNLEVNQKNNSYLNAAVVKCINSGFVFENISKLSISGLEFNGCKENSVRRVDRFKLEDCTFHTGHGIELEWIEIVTIRRSSFVSLTARETVGFTLHRKPKIAVGAVGAIVTRNSTMVLNECQFDANMAEYGGSIYSWDSNIRIRMTNFSSSITADSGGIIYAYNSTITIHESIFANNTAGKGGGVTAAFNCVVEIYECQFDGNMAEYGGSIYSKDSVFKIDMSTFEDNRANSDGSVVYANGSTNITIQHSTFVNNTALHGGVIDRQGDTIINIQYTEDRLAESYYITQTPNIILCSNKSVTCLTFTEYAKQSLETAPRSNITLTFAPGNHRIDADLRAEYIIKFILHVAKTNDFSHSVAMVTCNNGSQIFFEGISELSISGLEFNGCMKNTVRSVEQFRLENCRFHTGHGIEMDRIKNAIIERSSFVALKARPKIQATLFMKGGAIVTRYSTMVFNECQFDGNSAQYGGSIYAEYSDVKIKTSNFTDIVADKNGGVISAYIGTNITLQHSTFINSRADNGGVLWAWQGNILMSDCIFHNNTAHIQGGAIWINSTTLTSQHSLQITNNRALIGIVFAQNSMLSFFGNTIFSSNSHGSFYPLISQNNNTCTFSGNTSILNNYFSDTSSSTTALNSAFLQQGDIIFGGAIDFSYNQLHSEPQVKALISANKLYIYIFPDFTIYIPNSHSTALYSGGECVYETVYELNYKYETNSTAAGNTIVDKEEGIYRLNTNSQLQFSRPSPEPFRMCFCTNDQPDCNNHPSPVQVQKGQTFNITLVVVDQDYNPVPQALGAFLSSRDGRLGEGQSIQSTSFSCKEFSYTIFSPHDSEQLVLNAYGPCNNIGISQNQINVHFLPCLCPVGFNVSIQTESNCVCDCDPDIYPEYVTSCSFLDESVQRRGNKWIHYINTSDQKGYLIHSHCPFDYCHPSTEQIWINLNVANGADAQCAFNRSGKLCGSCEDGLSLSLGSSRCKPCSNNWIALLIVFAIAGVALVAFLLVCNLTVAVGTINGLIFYANIIAANRAIFIPLDNHNILTTFIAWLNLDFGFEICFYDGMNAYAKTWLQLAFPFYIISLVIAIIVISDYSNKFAALFTRQKDPIATLATLILLSYTKLIRTIIASLAFTTLKHLADGSDELVWLTDANISYIKGKHIPLFITALAIIIVGLLYTILLFGWQWLVNPKIKSLTWITKNGKVFAVMDAYHNPYNKDHRYWIGLLLLVRVLLYFIFAVNVIGDPRINLLSINSAVVILFFIQIFPGHIISKRKLVFTIENISFLNLIGFTIVTYYMTEYREGQAVVAYVSITIAFITFLAILVYHTCVFALTKQFKKVKSFFKNHFKQNNPTNEIVPSATIHQRPSEVVSETIIGPPPEPCDTLSDDGQRDTDEEIETSSKEHDTKPARDYILS